MSFDFANMPAPTNRDDWCRLMGLATSYMTELEHRFSTVGNTAERRELEGEIQTVTASVDSLVSIWSEVFTVDNEDAADAAAFDAHKNDETFPIEMYDAIDAGESPFAAFRKHRKMTQAALAQAVGTSAQYISQIERGERYPGRELLRHLADALNVEATALEDKTLSSFILTSALDHAESAVSESENLALKRKDSRTFFEALSRPVEFNDKLRTAFEEFDRRVDSR